MQNPILFNKKSMFSVQETKKSISENKKKSFKCI